MEDQSDNTTQYEYADTGTPSWVVAVLFAFIAVSLAGNAWQFLHKPDAANDQQAQLQIEQVKATGAFQARLLAVQLDIIKRCADKGNIPIVGPQSVDCKVQPK